jgi:formylmethanofuran dehydrogenase subunit E
MVKIPAAQARLFKNLFICKNCSSKIRVESRKILEGKVKCRKCKGRAFRPMRKK